MEDKISRLSSSSWSKPKRSFQLKKHKTRVERSDHINNLPDELLCNIISHLTLVEAARASALARRWNKLCYHFHGALEFDDSNKIMYLSKNNRKHAVHGYLSSNRQVLQSLPSPSFTAFRLRCYNIDGLSQSHLDSFVQFVMTKRIRSFELDTSPEPLLFGTDTYYKFPLEFYAWIKKPCGLDSISSLTSISSNHVIVSDELIHHLLVNCPLLESLCVRDSRELINPKFIGDTLKLKHLEISGFELESIEISAPNLSTFIARKYCGYNSTFKILIKDAPKLVELSVPVYILNYRPKSVSSYLPYLESLTWDFSVVNSVYHTCLIRRFVKQNKLRNLTWKLGIYHDEYTSKLDSLLEASPLLQKFTLVILVGLASTEKMVQIVTAKHPHQCLKVLQIDGFTGAEAEVKLVKYILANTTSLEEIILDTIEPCFRGTPWKGEPSRLRQSKRSALKLKECLPPRVSLVILEE